ncbi:MAG: hypothetical protein R3C12_05330 [Planctomycetaceae bacterium]
MLFALATGEGSQVVGGYGPVVATPGGLVKFVEGEAGRLSLGNCRKAGSKGQLHRPRLVPLGVGNMPTFPAEMIIAGTTVIVGADREVLAVDQQAQKIVWRAQVDGSVFGLAADGRLLVSTDPRDDLLFSRDSVEERKLNRLRVLPFRVMEMPKSISSRADSARLNLKEGYCLDLGCGDGRLAEALARRSQLPDRRCRK